MRICHILAKKGGTVEKTMTERRLCHLPILDRGQLAGSVSIGGVVEAQYRKTHFAPLPPGWRRSLAPDRRHPGGSDAKRVLRYCVEAALDESAGEIETRQARVGKD